MVFCQSCGARNTQDARFCNMCGARIAAAGEPGGPIGSRAESAPDPSTTTGGTLPLSAGTTTTSGSTVSLEAIGVRSGRRTWAILIGAGLSLFALGAGGMFLVMQPGAAPPQEAAEVPDEDDAPIEIGDPVPAGEELPEDIDFVPGTPRVTTTTTRPRTTTTSGSSTSGGTRTSGSSGSGSSTSGGSTSTGGSTSGGSTSTGGSTSGGTTTGGGTTGGSTTGGSTSSGSTTGGSTSSGSTTTGGSTGTVDWERAGGVAMGEEDEEDVLMDAYASHVRRYIREYYIRRAQMCFDHESRVDQQAVRGTVLIGFTIQGSGEVVGARVDRNTTGRDTLGSCLQRQVEEWRLPRPPEGIDELPMQMPFSR